MVMRTSGQRKTASVLLAGATGTDLTLSQDLSCRKGFAQGDAANPSWSFQGDTDTGLGRSAANLAAFFAGGGIYSYVQTLQFSGNGGAEMYMNTGGFRTGGTVRKDVRTVDIAAVGTAISQNGSALVRVTLSAGAIVSTATPFIADGSDGQEIWLCRHSDAGALTLSDEGTLAGSNLRLSANTIALGPRDVIGLRFLTAIGDWVQFSYVNVL